MIRAAVAQEPRTSELLKCSWWQRWTCHLLHSGEGTDGGGWVWERPHLLQSQASYRVPDKGSTGPGCTTRCVAWSYITSVCMCRRKRSRSSHRKRSRSPEEIRRELQSIPKAIHIPSGQGPPGCVCLWGQEIACVCVISGTPWPALIRGGGRAV